MADVDQRLLEVLSTIEPAVAGVVLQEAKVTDRAGVQNPKPKPNPNPNPTPNPKLHFL